MHSGAEHTTFDILVPAAHKSVSVDTAVAVGLPAWWLAAGMAEPPVHFSMTMDPETHAVVIMELALTRAMEDMHSSLRGGVRPLHMLGCCRGCGESRAQSAGSLHGAHSAAHPSFCRYNARHTELRTERSLGACQIVCSHSLCKSSPDWFLAGSIGYCFFSPCDMWQGAVRLTTLLHAQRNAAMLPPAALQGSQVLSRSVHSLHYNPLTCPAFAALPAD